jgi:hypothetical protein
MEDVTLAPAKLEAVVPDDYDEKVATTATLAASMADDEAKWSWLGLDDNEEDSGDLN